MKIFVYGTLLKGLPRSRALEGCRFLGLGFTQGVLHDLGSYPALCAGHGDVYGEIYDVDAGTVSELDAIEGYDPERVGMSLYLRKETRVVFLHDGSPCAAFAYFYNQSLPEQAWIECGDYRRYLLEHHVRQWYIAYGSNMSTARIQSRVGEICAIKTGYLENHELVFNKKAVQGGVYANISFADRGSRCPFAAYFITKDQLRILDSCEGEPSHYKRIGLAFHDLEGNAEIGQIYVARPEKLVCGLHPSPEYLEHIAKGYREHGFDPKDLVSRQA